MPREINFQINGEPRPWKRARLSLKHARFYEAKDQKDYKKEVVHAAQFAVRSMLGGEILTCPLEINLTFYLERKKSVKRFWASVKPDIDNCIKVVFDALQNVLYKNDSQVVRLTAEKVYCREHEDPCTWVKIIQLDEPLPVRSRSRSKVSSKS